MDALADVSMLDSAGRALLIIMDPTRLFFLAMGAMMGLILGILPGIGGLAGTAILLPFTFDMDPYTAFAFLLGLGSTGATGDPSPPSCSACPEAPDRRPRSWTACPWPSAAKPVGP